MPQKPYSEHRIIVPKFCEENGFYTTRQQSANMSKIRSKNTKPERIFKKALWHAGLRHRSNKRKLPGKPDIASIKHKLVIFVDGAFWHGHDWELRREKINANRAFWIPKIERNIQRDKEINAFYRSRGWTVMRFWDFEIKSELGACVKTVIDHLAAR